jgi:glycosyltransferase involved in cell wall biosynthesis
MTGGGSGTEATAQGTPVLVFHPGTQHSWQTARALRELGRLEYFATSIRYDPQSFPFVLERLPFVGSRLHREFARFAIPGLAPQDVRTGGWIEWAERAAQRAGLRRFASYLDRKGNEAFARQLAPDIASERPFSLWGYNFASVESFELGKRHGRICLLDQTIGDPRALDATMLALQEEYGDWFIDGYRPLGEWYAERADREYALADTILTGCDFAAGTLARHARADGVAGKTRVLEYCYDPAFDAITPRRHDPSGPVRFLFAGLGIPRKGIHHVLEAIAQFPSGDAQLTLLGSLGMPARTFAPYADRVEHIPTLARADVPSVMADHDVLLFPSYFEGAGLVLYEALASGMAVIQSDRAALAVTPETGLLLPEVSTEALVDAMATAISDRERLVAWRGAARSSVGRYSFAGYRDRIADLLQELEALDA